MTDVSLCYAHNRLYVAVSTGRGGAGNIRASSKTRAPDAVEPGADEARERSRERSRERGFGVVGGRGGAGNFRSASRAPEERIREEKEQEDAKEQEVGHTEMKTCLLPGHWAVDGWRIVIRQALTRLPLHSSFICLGGSIAPRPREASCG